MTPNDIEVLLHYHTSQTPHPREDAPAVKEATKRFVCMGLIELVDGKHYITTDRGDAFIKVLCGTPLPTQAWIDGYGNIIKV